MADLFVIDDSIRQLTFDAVSTMIHQLGKDCNLVFDSLENQCPNCFYDSVNDKSSGVYNGTGPVVFTRPPCPVCRGKGTVVSTPVEQTVKFLIDWQPRTWQFSQPNVTMPQGLMQTKGFIEDLPLVIQAKYLIVDPTHALYENNRFIKWGEPVPTGNISPNKFFTCLWQRHI